MKKRLIHRAASKLLRKFDVSYMPIFPVQLFLEITTICNLRCRTCYKTAWNLPSSDIPEPLLKKIIREIFPHIYHLELVGLGEPLCSKRFWPLFEHCIKDEIRVGTSTNGLLIDQDTADRLARAGSIITLSVDGRYGKTLDYVRPGITESVIENAMSCFKEAKQKYPDSGFRWSVHTVLLVSNIHEIPDLIEWVNRYGCTTVSFSQMNIEGRNDPFIRESLIDKDDLLARVIPEIERVAREKKVKPVFPPSIRRIHQTNEMDWGKQPGRYYQKCYSPWREVQITVDGRVFPCCIMGNVLGNMRDTTFPDIWNGKKYRNFRKTIHSGNPPECCRHCSMEYGITGGQPDYFDAFKKNRSSKVV